MQTNPNQYDALNESRGEKKAEELETERRFEDSAVGRAQAQLHQDLGEQLDTVKKQQQDAYKASIAGQVNSQANRVAGAAVQLADAANELRYKQSDEGKEQTQAQKTAQGQIGLEDDEDERVFKISQEGTEQAQQKKILQKEIGMADTAADIVYEESDVGQAQAQRAQALEGDAEIAKKDNKAIFAESEVSTQQAVNNAVTDERIAAAKAGDDALVQELRTEAGAEANPEYAAEAAALNEADIEKRVETQRSGAAQRVGNVEYANKVNDEATGLATRAGGVEGEAGKSQAQAVAKQTIIEAFKKGVAAEETLMSNTPENEILSADMLGDPDVLDQPDEKISAMGSTIAKRQHMLSHIELWSRMGELGQQVEAERTAAEAIADPTARQAALDSVQKKADKLENLQQIVMSSKTKTPFGIGDADQGAATVGKYKKNIYETTRERLNTHMSGKKLASLDPDDLRLIFEMAREGKLNDDELLNVAAAYDEWQKDPILKSTVEDKHRVLLDPIKKYVDSAGAVVDYPAPGSPPPPNVDNPNFWNSKFDDMPSKLSNP